MSYVGKDRKTGNIVDNTAQRKLHLWFALVHSKKGHISRKLFRNYQHSYTRFVLIPYPGGWRVYIFKAKNKNSHTTKKAKTKTKGKSESKIQTDLH